MMVVGETHHFRFHPHMKPNRWGSFLGCFYTADLKNSSKEWVVDASEVAEI